MLEYFQPCDFEIADKLNEILRYSPQYLRWHSDPVMAVRGVAILKSMGFRKPWLGSSQDFIAGVLLQSAAVYSMVSAEVILTDRSAGHINECWNGGGSRIDLKELMSMHGGPLGIPTGQIGGGFIIQFDVVGITAKFHGLIEDVILYEFRSLARLLHWKTNFVTGDTILHRIGSAKTTSPELASELEEAAISLNKTYSAKHPDIGYRIECCMQALRKWQPNP